MKKKETERRPPERRPPDTHEELSPEQSHQERELTIKEKDSANKRGVTWARTAILAIAVLLGLVFDKNGPAIAAAAFGLIERWAKLQ